jgi:hypothetical protein
MNLFLNHFRALAHRARRLSQVKRGLFRYARYAGEFSVSRAGTVLERTKLDYQTLAGLSAEEAVRMMNAAFLGMSSDGKDPADEILRRQVQVQLALREELAL